MSDPLQALRAVSGGDVQSSSTDLPNIPAVPTTDNSALANFLSSVKSWLEKAAGSATGFATKQEMINAGVLTTNESGAIVPTLPVSVGVPPAPTGLAAVGAVETIIVSWDNPAAAYGNHAYAEIWAKGDASFTGAVMIGQASSFMFAHVTGDTAQRWYWVRFVSTSGVKGPFSSVDGVPGSTGMDPAALFDAIAGSELATNPFFTITPAEVTAGTNVVNGIALPAGTYIKDAFIAAATISNAMIRNAAIDTAKIADLSVVQAKIANAAIGTAQIADAAILTAKIANAQITGAKIDTATITTANIADAQITAAKIADANITSAKIADANITNAKIGDAQISTLKVAGNSITVSSSSVFSGSTITTLATCVMSFAAVPQGVIIMFGIAIGAASGGVIEIRRNGSAVRTLYISNPDSGATKESMWHFVDTPSSGTITYTAVLTGWNGGFPSPYSGSFAVLGTLR